ncbi:MAG: hypothetical protein F7C35_08280 [Desulfurococcales archaeon]|nr:hypothetical protein [Desulfurococcales archaeon]
MTTNPFLLKERYREQWKRSNARERFVKLFLDVYLPQGFRAELTGLGAGSSEYIDRTYSGVFEAFDIVIFYEGSPAVFLDVTGVASPREALPGLGYCLGTWKLAKAEKFKVTPMSWAAFVLEDEPSILWAPYQKFKSIQAVDGRLYNDERPVRCLKRSRWLRWARFKTWLIRYGPVYARLLREGVTGY